MLKEIPNKSVRAEPVEAQAAPAQGHFDKLSPNGFVLIRRFLNRQNAKFAKKSGETILSWRLGGSY